MARTSDESPKKKRGKPRKPGTRQSDKTIAERADRHDLYQRSVQAPEWDLEFFHGTFKHLRGRTPRSLREDFCGTALLATTWVKGHHSRKALGVDLCRETLDWGREHNVDAAGRKAAERIQLKCADVRDVASPKVDFCCAMNFSYCVFKSRQELLGYFRAARRSLTKDGLFFLELYGGTEAIIELEEPREVDDFTYIWQQKRYNPINHETLCHIHFEFEDGSKLERAFTYDWRLWSVPELRELLAEAGFADSLVYWEEVDEDGDGNGEYQRTEEVENQEGWIVYVVGLR